MKLFKIALSNIRKRKSGAVTFFAITAMAALMLSISLSLLLNVGSFYDRKCAELNTPHFTIGIHDPSWQDSMTEYAENYPGVSGEPQIAEFYITDIKYNLGDGKVKQQIIFYNESVSKPMSTYTVIDRLETKPSDGGILLALNFKYGGFKAGDKFSFTCLKEAYEYTVAGFFEDAEFGASTNTVKAVYLSDEAYRRIGENEGFIKYRSLSLNFDKIEASYLFETDFLREFGLSMRDSFSRTYEATKFNATMFALIMSFVLILVAALVLAIALIIVRFTIKNNIEEDIKTLGALKSVGYTSKQIMTAIVIEFLLIAVLGGVAGALLGLATAGYVGNVVSMTSGLLWSGAAFIIPALLSVAAVTGVTWAVTYFVAGSSKSVTPINALRQGLGNHSFKKNYAPLDKTGMPLNVMIALKNFFGGLKNNITACIVLFLFGFTCVLGFALYQNFVVDTAAFKQMIGVEPAEVQLAAESEEFAAEHFERIGETAGVKQYVKFDVFSVTAGGKLLNLCVWEDIGQKSPGTLILGRFPQSDNEISLLSTVSAVLGKGTGDVIHIEYEGSARDYLVTGITQSVGGGTCDVTKAGFAKLIGAAEETIVLRGMNLFLDSGDTDYVDDFVDGLLIEYGPELNAINLAEAVNGTLVALKDPIAIATYFIIAITVFTVCFVFYLLMNTVMRRRKKDFGIMKALGFTNGQIILQMLLSFLPVILIGTALGIGAGVLLTNPLLGLMFSGLGIAKPLFVIPAALTAISGFALCTVSLLTVYLLSLKTRNISPQKLIVE